MRSQLRGIAALLGPLVACATWAPAIAATVGGTEAAKDITDVQTLDEVVVRGKLDSLSGLQAALVAAENRFYDRWNELNDDNRLDILCRTEAPTGTRLAKRRCEPQLVDEKTREAALQFMGVTSGTVHYESADAIRLEAAGELRRRTLLMLAQDAELRRALLERARLQQMYDDRRKSRFEDGRWFVWD